MQGNRIGGGGGHYGSGNSSAMMNSGIGNNGMLSTKQQMIQYLMNMKFTVSILSVCSPYIICIVSCFLLAHCISAPDMTFILTLYYVCT